MLSEPGTQLAPGDLKDDQEPPLPAAKRTPLLQCACPRPGRNVLMQVDFFFKILPCESHNRGSVLYAVAGPAPVSHSPSIRSGFKQNKF